MSPYRVNAQPEMCGQAKHGYVCTLLKLHKGDHVAECLTSSPALKWRQTTLEVEESERNPFRA